MKKEQINLIIFYFSCSLFIFFTTNYLSEFDLINTFGQKDIEQYYIIAKVAPHLPSNNSEILAHVSSRYMIPYLAGMISYLTNTDIFDSYKFLNGIFFLFFIFSINKLLNLLSLKFNEKIILFSLIFFNPYVIRWHIFQPVQTHDLLFFSLTIFFSIGILKKNFKYILVSALFMIFIRQTSIAFLVGGITFFLLEKEYKKIFIFTLFFLFFFKINNLVANSISPNEFNHKYAYGIFSYDFSNISKLIRFFFLPLVSFFPLFLLIIFSRKIKHKPNINLIITLLLISILMIAQPILGGPEWTQRNVVRISTLSYVIASLFVFETFNLEKLYKNQVLYFFFIIGLWVWSFHPLYSKFKFFSILRF